MTEETERTEAETSGPAFEATEAAFWEVRLSVLEGSMLGLASVLIALLNLNPVLAHPESQYLLWILAGTAWLTPMTGLMYSAASQYLPYPETSLFNPAQLGFVTWLIVAPFRYRRLRLRGMSYLAHFLPFALWISLTTGRWLSGMAGEYAKAIGYALIACQLANEARGQYLKLLLGLGWGSFLVSAAYWSYVFGLPVTLSEWGTPRQGIRRLGGVRADAVMVWPSLLFAFAVAAGVMATAGRRPPEAPRPPKWLIPAAVSVMVAGFPVLVSTMTTGGYVGLGTLTGAFVLLRVTGFSRRRIPSRWGSAAALYVLAAGLAVGWLVSTNALGLRTRMIAMWQHQREVAERQSLAASRERVWQAALRTIARHPWAGAPFAGADEELPGGQYRRKGVYLAHNVFLDAGRGGGVPAILLFAWFFFYPLGAMLRQPHREKFFPFLLLHMAFFVFFMGLSFQFFKTFWAGWMLMSMAARPNRDAESRR